MSRKILAVSIAAAFATAGAGILHLLMVPGSIYRYAGEGTLFLVGGALQVFWTVPVIRRWGLVWQAIGIGGTVVFTVLWFATHTHSLFGTHAQHMPEMVPQGNVSGKEALHGAGGREGLEVGESPRGLLRIPAIEFLQMAFIGLYSAIAIMDSRRQNKVSYADGEKK